MKILAFPHKSGRGGPGTFQQHFKNITEDEIFKIVYLDSNIKPDLILIIGGSSKILKILYFKLLGTKVILRLDGINYRHKYYGQDLKDKIRAVLTNQLIGFYRRFVADYIIYQSNFVKEWWEKDFGKLNHEQYSIIYNGTIIPTDKKEIVVDNIIKIVCVEGTIPPDPFVIDLINYFTNLEADGYIFELTIIGGILNNFDKNFKDASNIKFLGYRRQEEIKSIMKDSDIFLSLEINAACPNSVIEAMSNGLPIVAFNTGSMNELISNDIGTLIEFEGDSLLLKHYGDYSKFGEAIIYLKENLASFSNRAYKKSKSNFNIKNVIEKYMEICLKV